MDAVADPNDVQELLTRGDCVSRLFQPRGVEPAFRGGQGLERFGLDFLDERDLRSEQFLPAVEHLGVFRRMALRAGLAGPRHHRVTAAVLERVVTAGAVGLDAVHEAGDWVDVFADPQARQEDRL